MTFLKIEYNEIESNHLLKVNSNFKIIIIIINEL